MYGAVLCTYRNRLQVRIWISCCSCTNENDHLANGRRATKIKMHTHTYTMHTVFVQSNIFPILDSDKICGGNCTVILIYFYLWHDLNFNYSSSKLDSLFTPKSAIQALQLTWRTLYLIANNQSKCFFFLNIFFSTFLLIIWETQLNKQLLQFIKNRMKLNEELEIFNLDWNFNESIFCSVRLSKQCIKYDLWFGNFPQWKRVK